MKLLYVYLSFSILFSISVSTAHTATEKTSQFEQMRDTLPEKALTVDLILSRAMQRSNSFKQVQSELYKAPVNEYNAESAFDTKLEVSQNWLRDDNESSNTQSPDRTKSDLTSISLSRYFTTGTAVQFQYSEGHNDIGFPAGSFISIDPYYESKATLKLSQNLWADSFGYASRRGLKAAQLSTQAQKYKFQNEMEQWALGIVDLFYSAWHSQSQVLAARAGLKRRERLLSSTKLKLNRGTAETPDFLQVESAFLLSRANQMEAEKKLDDQWRNLIISLRLPGEWMAIDAIIVPMKMDNVMEKGEKLCKEFRIKGVPDLPSATVKSAQAASESSLLNWEKAQNERWPELKLEAQVFPNGIDNNNQTSREEAFNQDNPGWAVGLKFIMPLGRNDRKAKISSAMSDKMLYEAVQSDAKDNISLGWLNECANLERLKLTLVDADKAFKNQSRRADLEERRFSLGRSNTLNVIQAGDDATQSELFLRTTEVQIRQSAWKILKLNGDVTKELENFVIKNGGHFEFYKSAKN
jgi:outer membrane protein TolC